MMQPQISGEQESEQAKLWISITISKQIRSYIIINRKLALKIRTLTLATIL
jgi:hypothetical protein